MKRLRGLVLSTVLASMLAPGCSSPSTPALVKEETECQGFEQGGQKMKGGLKKPVRLRVLRDEEVVATVMLFGIQDAKHPTRFLLPDANEEYSLEFAQCANERAPHPDDGKDPKAQQKASVKFECNEPTVYSTTKHQTKRGDPQSMELPFPAPPSPECWEAPSAAPTASASASAAAAPSAEPPPTAEASASAAPDPSASAAPDPSASATAAPTAKPTAKPTATPTAPGAP